MKPARSSNFELCRLFCMFYIVVYHLFIHNKELMGSIIYTRSLTSIFSIGVPVFVMISGYFSIHRSLKGFIKLIFQVEFYSIIALLVSVFLYKESFESKHLLSILFPVSHTTYWFIGTYAILYIIAPYLNKFLEILTKKDLIIFIVTICILVCYLGGVMDMSLFNDRSLIGFILYYSIGWYLRQYSLGSFCDKSDIKKSFLLNPLSLYVVTSLLFFAIISFFPDILSRAINHLAGHYNRILMVVFASLFFCVFCRLSIQSKLINNIAKSSFAIYLIHGNNIVTYHRWLYDPFTQYGLQLDGTFLKLIYLFTIAFVVCIVCIVIDQIRILFFKYSGIDYLTSKIRI